MRGGPYPGTRPRRSRSHRTGGSERECEAGSLDSPSPGSTPPTQQPGRLPTAPSGRYGASPPYHPRRYARYRWIDSASPTCRYTGPAGAGSTTITVVEAGAGRVYQPRIGVEEAQPRPRTSTNGSRYLMRDTLPPGPRHGKKTHRPRAPTLRPRHRRPRRRRNLDLQPPLGLLRSPNPQSRLRRPVHSSQTTRTAGAYPALIRNSAPTHTNPRGPCGPRGLCANLAKPKTTCGLMGSVGRPGRPHTGTGRSPG